VSILKNAQLVIASALTVAAPGMAYGQSSKSVMLGCTVAKYDDVKSAETMKGKDREQFMLEAQNFIVWSFGMENPSPHGDVVTDDRMSVFNGYSADSVAFEMNEATPEKKPQIRLIGRDASGARYLTIFEFRGQSVVYETGLADLTNGGKWIHAGACAVTPLTEPFNGSSTDADRLFEIWANKRKEASQ